PWPPGRRHFGQGWQSPRLDGERDPGPVRAAARSGRRPSDIRLPHRGLRPRLLRADPVETPRVAPRTLAPMSRSERRPPAQAPAAHAPKAAKEAKAQPPRRRGARETCAASLEPVPSVAPAAGERIPVISKPRTIASRRPPRRPARSGSFAAWSIPIRLPPALRRD